MRFLTKALPPIIVLIITYVYLNASLAFGLAILSLSANWLVANAIRITCDTIIDEIDPAEFNNMRRKFEYHPDRDDWPTLLRKGCIRGVLNTRDKRPR